MKIPDPPRPGPELVFDLRIVDNMVQWVNTQLNDEHFDCRYFPKLEWFKDEVTRTERILNIGCGQGRETFALMWMLNAAEAVGIDINDDPKRDKIHIANVTVGAIREFAHKFPSQVIPAISRKYTSEYVDKLLEWYDSDVPDVIKNSIVPMFIKRDITEINLLNSNYFGPNYYDLVYSSYVLDKILDKNEPGLSIAIQNMTNLVKPELGRLVFVVPTKKEKNGKYVQYDFEQYYPEELTILKSEKNEDQLGRPEWSGTEPVGYILKRGANIQETAP